MLSQRNPGPFHVGYVRVIEDNAVPARRQRLRKREPLVQVPAVTGLQIEDLFRPEPVDVSTSRDGQMWWLSRLPVFRINREKRPSDNRSSHSRKAAVPGHHECYRCTPYVLDVDLRVSTTGCQLERRRKLDLKFTFRLWAVGKLRGGWDGAISRTGVAAGQRERQNHCQRSDQNASCHEVTPSE